METLRSGSRGEAVEALQKMLLGKGINPGPVDGVFGTKTMEAVRRLQQREGLEADGVAGPKTLAALEVRKDATKGDLSDLAEKIKGKKKKAAKRPGDQRTV